MRAYTFIAFGLALIACSTFAEDSADAERHQALSEKGKQFFKNTRNHCLAFRDIVTFAVSQSKETGVVLEDLKWVLIGEDIRKRGKGPYYIGNTPGARGDTGFKSELKDNSPQVEHAMAAIYVGKFYPPGSAEALALATEVAQPLLAGSKVNPSDALLWSLGADAGQRVNNKELDKLPRVIERTMCK
jgi:hypothetical protein